MISGIRIRFCVAGGRHYARIFDSLECIASGRGATRSEAVRDAVQDCRAGRYGRCRTRELQAAIALDERMERERRELHDDHRESLAVDDWRGANE